MIDIGKWTITRTLILAMMLMVLPAVAWPFDLTIRISGATPDAGQIQVSLFESEDTYMMQPYRDDVVPVDNAGRSSIVFDGLPQNRYAVSLFYDRNTNGELDTNLFGVPTEAFGFSNNAKAFFGPPDWAEAAFSLDGDLTIDIELDAAN